MHKKSTNTRMARMLHERRDHVEYRNSLASASYPSSEYFELENIYKQEEKVKQRLNLPQNSLIRYDKVKCSKHCKHNNPPHQYYYAYIWDSCSKRLQKKYIGKQLPLVI
jgi:hypothetical protein